MIANKQYQIMQFGIDERKLKLLEKESTIKMEKLRAEAAYSETNPDKDNFFSIIESAKTLIQDNEWWIVENKC